MHENETNPQTPEDGKQSPTLPETLDQDGETETGGSAQAAPSPPDHSENSEAEQKIQAAQIRMLNDILRQTFIGGIIKVNPSIEALGKEALQSIVSDIRRFSEFNEDNDPWHEHDFGIVCWKNERIFWKIDYFDKDLLYGSEDPANPNITTRVLTIYLAGEH